MLSNLKASLSPMASNTRKSSLGSSVLKSDLDLEVYLNRPDLEYRAARSTYDRLRNEISVSEESLGIRQSPYRFRRAHDKHRRAWV